MGSSGQNPLRFIETLPATARVDLMQFIESSAETSVTDEAAYLRSVLALHRRSFARLAKGGKPEG